MAVMDTEHLDLTGTAAAIHAAAAAVYVRRITIQAARENTGVVSVGGATTQGMTLIAGEAMDVYPGLSSKVYAKSSVVGDIINFIPYLRD